MAKKRNDKRKRPSPAEVEEEEDLDRFAGSSEEESEVGALLVDDEGNDSNEEHVKRTSADNHRDDGGEADQESSSEEDSEDELGEEAQRRTGMASAMSKILGTQTSKQLGTQSVVLSKTVTPLQRMMKAEKVKEKEAREKRKQNRERNLAALHVPLSVATARTITTESASIAKELELERTHRRVATRGVVALFNAIAQHQKKRELEAATSISSTSKGGSSKDHQKLSKHGFLEAIKKAAEEKNPSEKDRSDAPKSRMKDDSVVKREVESKPKWTALKDDYMMNSKLKDWDKESSDDESSDEVRHNVGDDWSEDDDQPSTLSKKRRKLTSQ